MGAGAGALPRRVCSEAELQDAMEAPGCSPELAVASQAGNEKLIPQ